MKISVKYDPDRGFYTAKFCDPKNLSYAFGETQQQAIFNLLLLYGLVIYSG